MADGEDQPLAFDPFTAPWTGWIDSGPVFPAPSSDLFGFGGANSFTQFGGGGTGQMLFLDTQTGQIVTGDQAQQISPTDFKQIMDVLNAGKSAINAANGTAPGTNQGTSLKDIAALAASGGSLASALAGLGRAFTQSNPAAPAAPGLTGTQQGLIDAQTGALNQYQQLLNQQIATNQATLPGMLSRAGFVPNTAGGITDIYGTGIQNATLSNLGLTGMYQNQAQQTMGQDLTKINPALTQYLNDQTTQFQGQARSQFGPGYEASTPYQIANYYQNLAKTNALASNQLNYLNAYQNLANAAFTGSQVSPGTVASAQQPGAATAGQLGNLSAGFQNPLASLQSQQLLGYQGQLNQYNANTAQNAALGSALGSFSSGLGQLGVGLGQSNALASLLSKGGGLG